MNRVTRIAAAVTAGCLSLVLAACGAPSPAGSTGDLEVFSWWTSGSENAALNTLLAAYTSATNGAKVVNGAIAGGGGGNAQAVLQARLQGGNPPDVWQTHPGAAISQYIESGLVADVSSVYSDDTLTGAIPKKMIDAISKDGKQYGVSTGAHRGNVLWYNTKALAKAGIAAPQAGYSTDAFLTDLAKLKAAGTIPLCLGAKDTFAIAELFENTLLGTGGGSAWNALTARSGDWHGAQVTRAAEQFGTMLTYADPDAGALSWDQATKKLGDGACAFESMGDWAYGELVKNGAQEGTDFGYTAHPGSDGAFMAVVDTMVMAQNAKNAEAAKTFMAAITTKETQLAFNRAKGSTALRTDIDISSLPKYQQSASSSFKRDELVQSIVHGEAMNPRFAQALNDAVTQFAQTKDVESFTKKLAAAAS